MSVWQNCKHLAMSTPNQQCACGTLRVPPICFGKNRRCSDSNVGRRRPCNRRRRREGVRASPSRAAMRASLSHAAQHITLEYVCTRDVPRNLPDSGVGTVVYRDARDARAAPDVRTIRHCRGASGVRRKRCASRRGSRIRRRHAVPAETHRCRCDRTHTAVAGERLFDALLDQHRVAIDAIHRLQRPVAAPAAMSTI